MVRGFITGSYSRWPNGYTTSSSSKGTAQFPRARHRHKDRKRRPRFNEHHSNKRRGRKIPHQPQNSSACQRSQHHALDFDPRILYQVFIHDSDPVPSSQPGTVT